MKYEDIIKELQNKIYKPVYFLYGKEPYYIDLVLDYISDNILPPEEQAFNQFIFYGKDSQLANIIGQAKKFPMMSNHQVIIVREAQDIKGLTTAPTKDKPNMLAAYAANPLPSTILVIGYKIPADSQTKIPATFIKALGSKTVTFESTPLYEDKIPGWISQHVKSLQYQIEPDGIALLAEHVGNSLNVIASEVEKLIISMPAGSKNITAAMVEKLTGKSREYSIFELQNALSTGNSSSIVKIAHNISIHQKDKIIYSISQLFVFFTKVLKCSISKNKGNNQELAMEIGVNPYFLKNYLSASSRFNQTKCVTAISLLREYDLKCKGLGSNDDNSELFRELIMKIIYL
ncbi:MAG: DNA polymerase III subunit delta [Bacteroidetes bacterium HGW-Bacteroidetes-21]|nr:MAG: DNA polymerase III subunit delta [Bacteroidetes bacterium HGW-Bacteroidetes-21]